jgi:hypothetical protein
MSARERLLAALEVSPEVRPGEGPALVNEHDAGVQAKALEFAIARMTRWADREDRESVYSPGINFAIGILQSLATGMAAAGKDSREAESTQQAAPGPQADGMCTVANCGPCSFQRAIPRPGYRCPRLAAAGSVGKDICEAESTWLEPLVVRWDRTVIHPEADPTDDTVVCCCSPEVERAGLLRDAVLAEGGQWTTHRALKVFRDAGVPITRHSCRSLLHELADEGVLAQIDRVGRRYYIPSGSTS